MQLIWQEMEIRLSSRPIKQQRHLWFRHSASILIGCHQNITSLTFRTPGSIGVCLPVSQKVFLIEEDKPMKIPTEIWRPLPEGRMGLMLERAGSVYNGPQSNWFRLYYEIQSVAHLWMLQKIHRYLGVWTRRLCSPTLVTADHIPDTCYK